MTAAERAAHCRKIASSGGRSTYEKYGATHMAKIGRFGQSAWIARYFAGDRAAAHRYLGDMGARVYANMTQLPKKYTVDGFPVW